ncbi:hypothetical protein LTS18_012651 [Coniosporium uncinatum]|uniref:Uncharacterized protein n=1 Tax=Coniosporium uncinatum TaxID=93489 RepID=A0ACC3DVV1_9PEZI|nr:hypothetical protein LTS18_012651 [Coniosporium uncinatum]
MVTYLFTAFVAVTGIIAQIIPDTPVVFKRCGRVSCERNGGIYFCQDSDHEINIAWDDVAAAAKSIIEQCTTNEDVHLHQFSQVEGHMWSDDD